MRRDERCGLGPLPDFSAGAGQRPRLHSRTGTPRSAKYRFTSPTVNRP